MNCALHSTLKATGGVAVLIPHFNDLAGLNMALASLATESAAVIIIDDSSATPPKEQALHQAHPYLKSLQIVHLAESIGIARGLNVGLSYASDYDYIARLDCGDQSLPGRIATQKTFLDIHPQCHLVGSWAEYIHIDSGMRYVNRYPSDHRQVLRAMYHHNAFCPSATMYRRETALALGGYPIKFKEAEEYALFFAIARKYETSNIRQVKVKCHIMSSGRTTAQQERIRALSSLHIIARNIKPGYVLTSLREIAQISAQLALGIVGIVGIVGIDRNDIKCTALQQPTAFIGDATADHHAA